MANYFASWSSKEIKSNADLHPWDARDEALARMDKIVAQKAKLAAKIAKMNAEISLLGEIHDEAQRQIARQQAAA